MVNSKKHVNYIMIAVDKHDVLAIDKREQGFHTENCIVVKESEETIHHQNIIVVDSETMKDQETASKDEKGYSIATKVVVSVPAAGAIAADVADSVLDAARSAAVSKSRLHAFDCSR